MFFVGRGATILEKKSCTENIYRKKTDEHIYNTTHVVLLVELYYTLRGFKTHNTCSTYLPTERNRLIDIKIIKIIDPVSYPKK